MVPTPLMFTPSVTIGGGTVSMVLVFKENLRNRVGGVVVGVTGGTTVPTGIKDDQGNSYALVTSTSNSGANNSSVWYCQKVVGCPQRLTITWPSNSSQITAAAVFLDQPLLTTSSLTAAANTAALTVGPLTATKSGEELVFAVMAGSNINSTPPGMVVIYHSTAASFDYAYPPRKQAAWTNSASVLCNGCIASFRSAPVATNQWAFDRITKFPGTLPPPDLSASWADTLTWTVTTFDAAVEASWSDTLTWTYTHTAAGVDAFLADTLTWTYSHNATGVDEVPLTDTLTWTGSFTGLPEIVVLRADLLIWCDEFQFDRQILEGVNWADHFSYDGEVYPDLSASWADTLTWTWAPVMGQDVGDTVTWSDGFTLPDRSAFTSDAVTWGDVFVADVNLLGIGRYRR